MEKETAKRRVIFNKSQKEEKVFFSQAESADWHGECTGCDRGGQRGDA